MKPIVFLDTNIILDVLAMRSPYHIAAVKLFSLADNEKIVLTCTALSFANAAYHIRKSIGQQETLAKLQKLKIICKVLVTSDASVEKALHSNFIDFEDALQYFSAVEGKASVIITRDSKGYRNSDIPVMNAEEYLSLI